MKVPWKPLAAFVVLAALGAWLIPGVSDFPLTHLNAAELSLFGLGVGMYGTMVGAGGGFLIVPVLLLIWHVSPAQAAGTSLTVVFLNAAAGSWSYAKQGRVDYRSGFYLAAATLPGAVAGAFMAKWFSGRVFSIVFAVFLLTMGSFLVWKPVRGRQEKQIHRADGARDDKRWWWMHRDITDKSGHRYVWDYNLLTGLILSFFVGFMSSILGIGGGIIHVPALIHLLFFSSHLAAATSHFILAMSALVGAGTHVALGDVLFGPAALMGIGVIPGAQLGALLAKKSRGAVTIRLLSIALFVVAIRLLMR
jgi:uncharacterized membrane protein YfcA